MLEWNFHQFALLLTGGASSRGGDGAVASQCPAAGPGGRAVSRALDGGGANRNKRIFEGK